MIPWLLLPAAHAHHPHDPTDLLAVSPDFATDGTVFITRNPSQNWRPLELAVSRDGGWTWSGCLAGLNDPFPYTSVSVSPQFSADGLVMVTTAGGGAWLSADRGRGFSSVLPGEDLDAGVIAAENGAAVLLVHPAGGALLRSTDQGATWSPVPGSPLAVDLLRAHGPDVIVVSGHEVLLSRDGGATFAVRTFAGTVNDADIAEVGFAVASQVGLGVALTDQGPVRPVSAAQVGVTHVALAPRWPLDPVLFTTRLHHGPYRSGNGGLTFDERPLPTQLSNQSTEHFLGLTVSDGFPGDGTVFLNMFEGLFLSTDGGFTWRESDTRIPGVVTALSVSPDFATNGTLVVGTYDAGILVSDDRGDTFRVSNTGLQKKSAYAIDTARIGGRVVSAAALRSRGAAGSPPYTAWHATASAPDYPTRLALSPRFDADGRALLGHRTQGIWLSTDHGTTYAQAFPDPSQIASLAWAPDGLSALAGTRDGRVLASTDAGTTWSVGADAGVDAPLFVAADAAGWLRGDGTGAYTSTDGVTWTAVPGLTGVVHQVAAAPDGTRFVSMRGGSMWRADPGQGFVPVAADLAAFGTASELATSPDFAADGTLFAAIDDWVFRSEDRGDTWTLLGPSVVRFEEDAQAVDTPSGAPAVPMPGASVARAAVLSRGQRASLSFHGTGVTWIGATVAGTSIVEVSLDGVLVDTVDAGTGNASQVPLYTVSGLAPGPHQLDLRVTSGTGVVDAFDVTREVAMAPPAPPLPAGPAPARAPATVSSASVLPPGSAGCDIAGAGEGIGAALVGLGLLCARRGGGARVRGAT